MAEAEQTPEPAKPVSPYQGLDDRAYWRSGVAEAGAWPPADLYRPKFPITKEMPIFTAGSCFAQHVGRALAAAEFSVIDTETLPSTLPDDFARRWGYRMYSARYGNLYTTKQLRQLLGEALFDETPALPVWEKDGRFYDAQRPNVTPEGLDSPEMVLEARRFHLEAIRDGLAEAQVFVFTLGLTEAWQHRETGTVYPTAPGTIAGQHDGTVFEFVNYRAAQVRADFEAAREMLQMVNPDIRFLLTVSPVPLTATASGQHVLPATVYSKSVLRTVAGELTEDFDDIDYFPSYEIVSSPAASEIGGAAMFDPNQRTVKGEAVARVMASFLDVHDPKPTPEDRRARRLARLERRAAERQQQGGEDAVVCEEELLEAFRK
jgi:hypothetical protein